MAVTKSVPRLLENPHTLCPGCGHGIVFRLLAEVLEEEGYDQKTILTLGVGCCCNMNPPAWKGDVIQTAHGRAGATATGAKVGRPDLLSIAYQGDGDAYVIGLAETLNAAYRNEPITVITVLNNNFAMTGGQMSWTTMPGQVTVTSPNGRDCDLTGLPIKVPEIVASFENVNYVARGTTISAAEINKLKKYIQTAVRNQIEGKGYSMVEVVSPCPTNWRKGVADCAAWMNEEVIPYYPLGELKNNNK